MNKLQEFKESFVEVLLITKACLTTFWFWLPALFAAYMYFQLWIVFFVHPLTILILPVVLAAFATIWEEKRVKAQYGLDKIKLLSASNPLGTSPTWKKVRWDVEKAIREYKESLGKAEEKKEEEES